MSIETQYKATLYKKEIKNHRLLNSCFLNESCCNEFYYSMNDMADLSNCIVGERKIEYPQLELFPLEQVESINTNQESSSFIQNKKNLLGQVNTPHVLAKFMIYLLKKDLQANQKILDPCIGPNTFLSYLDDIDSSIKIKGVELDKSLISEKTGIFFAKPNRELVLDSFFNLSLSEKYDYIIQNPPYVRQELMMDGENSKTKALKSLPIISDIIPSKSNLYVYFLLKAIFHLTDRGRMIAVIYDSWLYSDFGKVLKEVFIRFGIIEGIYHFKKNAFPDADVGATVIDYKRIISPIEKPKQIKLYSLRKIEEIATYESIPNLSFKQILVKDIFTFRFNEETVIDFKSAFFKPISQLSRNSIQRGISSIANEYFINRIKLFEESIPFVKDVTTIKTFSVESETSFLLNLSGTNSPKAMNHIENVRKEILANSDKFKALKEQIQRNQDWFVVKLKKPGNILFNYYLRKNIDFLLNEELHYSSDNFYILNIEENLMAYFAILNSTFTRISVLLHSRNQGNGLRKIQLYEFKDIPVIDINKLSSNTIQKLEIAGRELKSVSRFSSYKEKMINGIDEILIEEYNLHNSVGISTPQIHADIENIFSMN
ncbi:MAG: SAM-dependent methyltransferase [Candidatus Delongbacteria bacterium]|nr:SAM-dependent methyltransferase [Candidatus Delongbacteria bacterium]MCG2760076.1 SAM-dependent methyltransferase [Candidatus Delongbacteria bacterium]